ncbi:MAG TPA: hypothetical protein VFI82_10970 [Terriglobales bacterium]|nr:hypothetical protein [Terriglobales bacterium]
MSRRACSVALAAASVVSLAMLFAIRTVAADQERAQGQRVYATAPRDDGAAAAAFQAILPVLHHPRCMNCHSRGDFPRQGDDSHRHTMNVRRGPDGDGIAAVKCSTCHQDQNVEGRHTPPGAPDWHLPPPGMAMIWEGLTDRQLCELFKDRTQNGGRDVDGIVEHMSTPLVLWGWNPGGDRTPVPIPQTEFLANVKQWAAKGAACPGEGTARTGGARSHTGH